MPRQHEFVEEDAACADDSAREAKGRLYDARGSMQQQGRNAEQDAACVGNHACDTGCSPVDTCSRPQQKVWNRAVICAQPGHREAQVGAKAACQGLDAHSSIAAEARQKGAILEHQEGTKSQRNGAADAALCQRRRSSRL